VSTMESAKPPQSLEVEAVVAAESDESRFPIRNEGEPVLQ
jgi:hypothetical protein